MENFYSKRIDSFNSLMRELEEAKYRNDIQTDRFVLSGLIQKYNLAFDLAWKSMKDILTGYHGLSDFSTGSPRETLEAAYRNRLIDDDEAWIKMMRTRNKLAHDYNSDFAYQVIDEIISRYIPVFEKFQMVCGRYQGRSLSALNGQEGD